MCNHGVYNTHLVCALGRIFATQEEDFAGKLLTNLASQKRAAIAGVERCNIGICLLEARVLARRNRKVSDHVERVPAAGGPSRHQCDHDFRHKANHALNLENVKATAAAGVDARCVFAVGIFVAVLTTHALISAARESPAAILGRRTIAGQKNNANLRVGARVLECGSKLIDSLWPERVANLWAIESDAHHAEGFVAVIGDVGCRLKTGHLAPDCSVEQLGYLISHESRLTTCPFSRNPQLATCSLGHGFSRCRCGCDFAV
ncbi:unannotated protein [freshwater metagenome]|uniref:Unannotated protein n=1 Tax=freshwater metagenome TaxID=449393 RepID=A0A6J6NKN9_9ZZZZ